MNRTVVVSLLHATLDLSHLNLFQEGSIRTKKRKERLKPETRNSALSRVWLPMQSGPLSSSLRMVTCRPGVNSHTFVALDWRLRMQLRVLDPRLGFSGCLYSCISIDFLSKKEWTCLVGGRVILVVEGDKGPMIVSQTKKLELSILVIGKGIHQGW